jgi:hypothetical protein
MRSALPKYHSALLKYWISIIKCWFAWILMMSFLPVFTVEIWRYYTVIGGPNNRLTGNGKKTVLETLDSGLDHWPIEEKLVPLNTNQDFWLHCHSSQINDHSGLLYTKHLTKQDWFFFHSLSREKKMSKLSKRLFLQFLTRGNRIPCATGRHKMCHSIAQKDF